MPTYLFIHPDSEETIEIFQKYDEPHIYIDEKGVEWGRIFTVPNVGIDTRTDPFSKDDYTRSTDKKGNLGDLYDRAKEDSQKRKDKMGYDPVQKKWFDDYSKERRGKKHPNDPSLTD